MNKFITGMLIAAAGAIIASLGIGIVVLFCFFGSLLTGTLVYFLWHWAAPLYFDFLPAKYIAIPWFHTVLLTWFASVVGTVLFKGTGSSSSNE